MKRVTACTMLTAALISAAPWIVQPRLMRIGAVGSAALAASLVTPVQAQVCFNGVTGCPAISNVASSTSNIAALFGGTNYRQVANTTTETSAVPQTGVGSMTIPANYPTAGKKLRLKLHGSYQTPMLPGSVLVKVKLGSVVLAQVNVASSLFAASSTVRELYGEAIITYYTVGASGTAVCDGYLSFEIGNGVVTVPFSTAATQGNPTAVSTVNTTQAAILDVTETWTSASPTQGTTITQATLEALN